MLLSRVAVEVAVSVFGSSADPLHSGMLSVEILTVPMLKTPGDGGKRQLASGAKFGVGTEAMILH